MSVKAVREGRSETTGRRKL